MYKVFLVEDEIVVRESIRDSIPWTETEFIFVGESSDGEVAVPLIKKLQPDILITDIKMPFMDGLELSSFIKKTMPKIKIIMISGHQEFTFAKKAISIGVEEYVLKPIDSKELLSILKKVAKGIEIERKNLENIEATNKYKLENDQLIKEKVLNELLSGTIPSHIAADQLASMGIALYAKHYAIMNIVYLVNQYWDPHQNIQLNKVIDNLILHDPNVIKFNKNLSEVILILKGDDEQALEKACLSLKIKILEEVEELVLPGISIASSSVRDRIQGIASAYKEIDHSESENNIICEYQEILLNELKNKDEYQLKYSKFNDDKILTALRYENSEGVMRIIEEYFNQICDIRLTSIWSIYLAIRINLICADFLTSVGKNASDIVPPQKSIEQLAANLDTHEKLRKYMEGVCLSALEYRNQDKKSNYFEIIEAAKKYLDKNYSNPDISLNEVSEHVHMSSCYFSSIFSHETGITFTKYLTNIRINKAKMLLQTTNLKTGEIGLRVGYKDPHYFSYIFKKNTGHKPSEYKNE